MLTKRTEKKLDSNNTKMLQPILNKSWRQHPTKQQLYGHLPPITKTIKVRRSRHAGHCWRSRDNIYIYIYIYIYILFKMYSHFNLILSTYRKRQIIWTLTFCIMLFISQKFLILGICLYNFGLLFGAGDRVAFCPLTTTQPHLITFLRRKQHPGIWTYTSP